MEMSPYKHLQAGQPGCRDESSKIRPQAIFNLLSKQSQNNKIAPASGMKFSHKHKRNSSRLPGCLAKRASPASI
jgi:hypothetical protein